MSITQVIALGSMQTSSVGCLISGKLIHYQLCLSILAYFVFFQWAGWFSYLLVCVSIVSFLFNSMVFTLLCSFVAFWRPEAAGNHSALEDEIHAEENIYIIH